MKFNYNGHRLEVSLDFANSNRDDGGIVDSIIVCRGKKWREVLHRLSDETVEEIAARAWEIYGLRQQDEIDSRPSDFFPRRYA